MPLNPLWSPSKIEKNNSILNNYKNWLLARYNIKFNSYQSLWQWSTTHIEDFWESLIQYFNITFHSPYKNIISGSEMPGVKWFEGATLNYTEHIFKNYKANKTAIIFGNESGEIKKLNWLELKQKVSAMAHYLKTIGVKKGDCVVAFLPNTPEATISFLAVNSLGAIWSSTSPDFGVDSVIDRFSQIKPKVIIAVNGYYYNGKPFNKTSVVNKIVTSLPSIEKVLIHNYINETEAFPEHYIDINTLWSNKQEPLEFVPVEFNDPIWVLYSSGTTGLPKPIVHSTGGILLEHYKYMAFHNDVKPNENYFWFSTTGWMMWNFLQASLLMGATMVLYDGSPTYPNLNALWNFSDKVNINHFGTSAPFLIASMKHNISPKNTNSLSSIRSISSTGAPLPPDAFKYVYKHIKNDVWLCSMAGGTDVCTAFVGGCLDYPVHTGEIQCRALGVSLFAYNSLAETVEDELGEMVIDKPMPSMPIYFWNDAENKRYKASYFENYPGKWRHGDFIKINSETEGLVIYGRSDATLNRHGIRIGTAEIYRAIDKITEIEDALIVNLELEGGNHYMPLFVKMKTNEALNDNLKAQINHVLKTEYSPRHVPDDIVEVPDIPYTISGKKMEAPIKKVLFKIPLEKSINMDAMKNPESVNFFIDFAKTIN
ncbi:acetoacetate--CoA ligase [Neotamlana laminarinivorans]|uniref:Acetoacetate--CoA ligase n=1 Tax=Neotamlana laminarinivorans TaxID=2883124 RepID=A0A9X1L3M4_9FLAO|nr:acetoacetate--CoA ligase [Tamlana laminarinivorans]MCB4798387.1 acetoacetate--CoA ligase [Tamlana laminarinivorans]